MMDVTLCVVLSRNYDATRWSPNSGPSPRTTSMARGRRCDRWLRSSWREPSTITCTRRKGEFPVCHALFVVPNEIWTIPSEFLAGELRKF